MPLGPIFLGKAFRIKRLRVRIVLGIHVDSGNVDKQIFPGVDFDLGSGNDVVLDATSSDEAQGRSPSQGLVQHHIQIFHAHDLVVVGKFSIVLGHDVINLLLESLLDRRIFDQLVSAEGQGLGGGVVAGDEHNHGRGHDRQLVKVFFVSVVLEFRIFFASFMIIMI